MKERTICAVWVVLGGWLVRGVWVEDLGGGGGTLGGAEMLRSFGD
jgi:hypothetical protein